MMLHVGVTRGPLVESVHEVRACAVDAAGSIVLARGDVDALVFVRSAAKPFIAGEIVASGAADRFGFDARELAVIAASHNGEPAHVAAVRAVLAKIGLGPEALQCGTHPPADDAAAAALAASGEAPSALHNNCSGKHAGILAMCVHLGLEHASYLSPEHPVQQRILAFYASIAGDDPARMPLGIDGCGIPIFATPLRLAALTFARLASLTHIDDRAATALARVRSAMIAEPFYVAGSGRLDTALMTAARGRIACKAGAEGVHGSALLERGAGLAVKVVDGARRAAAPAVVAMLHELGALAAHESAELAAFARPEVRNAAGRVVGHVAVVADTIAAGRTS